MAIRKVITSSGPAYYQESPQGIQAITDPTLLRQLHFGQAESIPASMSEVKGYGNREASFGIGTQSGAGTNSFSSPSASFSSLLTDLLKSYQGISITDLQNKRSKRQQEVLGRVSAETPENLRYLSPAEQEKIRGAQAGALEPGLNATTLAIKQQEERGQKFLEAVNMVKDIAKELLPDAKSVDFKLQAVSPEDDLYQFDPTTGEYELLKKGTPKPAGSGTSNINIDNERSLLTTFLSNPITKNFAEVQNKKYSVDAIVDLGVGGPGDLALVYEFMKALDPTSVVRETEYASAAASGNIFLGALARFNGYLKESGGFLPNHVKKSFKSIVNTKFETYQKQFDNFRKSIQELAKRQGLNPNNVVVDLNQAFGADELDAYLQDRGL